MAATLTTLPLSSSNPTHFVYLISNLLTPTECDSIITSHTNLVPSETTPGTIRKREQFSNPELLTKLWSRLRLFYERDRVQDEDGNWWRAKGLNGALRLSRYEEGGKFTPHFDYRRMFSLDEQSFMSVNIYLNTVPEEFKGATRILATHHEHQMWDGLVPLGELEVWARIQPVQGTASIFRDTLWHDGEELLGGEKYLLRTDLVYEREGLFDWEEVTTEMGREEKSIKAMNIGYSLSEGGNRGEAAEWFRTAFELNPRIRI